MKNFYKIFISIFLLVQGPSAAWSRIIDAQGYVLPEVVEIFRAFAPILKTAQSLSAEKIKEILDPHTSPLQVSLKDLNTLAQEKFKRPENVERAFIQEFNQQFIPYTTPVVYKLLDAIGNIKPIDPSSQTARYILLNGSTVQNMRKRLETLIGMVESNKINLLPETEIIFLTGSRDLFSTETPEILKDTGELPRNPNWVEPETLPKTEYEAAQWVWNQTALPTRMRAMNTHFIHADKHPETNRRPTTFDTVITWLKLNPKPGHCLSISSQPFIHYQEATIRGVFAKAGMLDQGFSVEGVGFGVEHPEKMEIAIFLDNLARTIYTELQNLSHKTS